MKEFHWNEAKNTELRRSRGVSFEEIVNAIATGGLRDVLKHRNVARYPRQSVFVVELRDYAYLVPFVEETDHYFLKTIIPSRKATRDHLRKRASDEETNDEDESYDREPQGAARREAASRTVRGR